MNWTQKFAASGYRSDYKAQEPSVKRCKGCKHRIRGVNHDEGSHHKSKAR